MEAMGTVQWPPGWEQTFLAIRAHREQAAMTQMDAESPAYADVFSHGNNVAGLFFPWTSMQLLERIWIDWERWDMHHADAESESWK